MVLAHQAESDSAIRDEVWESPLISPNGTTEKNGGTVTGKEGCFGLIIMASRTLALERHRHCLDQFWLNFAASIASLAESVQ